MCGIAGSSDLEKAYTLYKLNLKRGSHSSGFMALSFQEDKECISLVEKAKGIFNLNLLKQRIKDLDNVCNFSYFAFHSRAPTNSTETIWKESHTHPFNNDSYYVAHNGIISNFKSFPEHSSFEVDSSIIPYLLTKNHNISQTYSKLQGLLTSWVFTGKKFYVVKAGSSLWVEKDSFSSSEFENAERIKEDGVILELKDNFLTVKDSFKYTNPYFI
jgi:glucosamine 6-phosphate synthetase-like amidotransferase/phosphosugar isomerase protein